LVVFMFDLVLGAGLGVVSCKNTIIELVGEYVGKRM
jgi:hypothetical protein